MYHIFYNKGIVCRIQWYQVMHLYMQFRGTYTLTHTHTHTHTKSVSSLKKKSRFFFFKFLRGYISIVMLLFSVISNKKNTGSWNSVFFLSFFCFLLDLCFLCFSYSHSIVPISFGFLSQFLNIQKCAKKYYLLRQ